jgi:hypothetical protein
LVSCWPHRIRVGWRKRRMPSTARMVSRLCSRSSCQLRKRRRRLELNRAVAVAMCKAPEEGRRSAQGLFRRMCARIPRSAFSRSVESRDGTRTVPQPGHEPRRPASRGGERASVHARESMQCVHRPNARRALPATSEPAEDARLRRVVGQHHGNRPARLRHCPSQGVSITRQPQSQIPASTIGIHALLQAKESSGFAKTSAGGTASACANGASACCVMWKNLN